MHEDFAGWLSAGPREIGQSPAFPELVERRMTGNGGLSAQFRAIVALEGQMLAGHSDAKTHKGAKLRSGVKPCVVPLRSCQRLR